MFCVQAHAATITSKTGGGNWTTGSTWVGNAAPQPTDDVVINGPVSVTSSVTCAKLTVNSSKTLTLSGSGLITIAKNSYATVLVNNGTINTNSNTISFYSTSSVEHTISGSGNITFYRVTGENVGLKFSSSKHTIGNTIRLNTGSWIETQPTYSSSAVLEINRSIVAPLEWHADKIWPSGNTNTVAPHISITAGTTTMSWLSNRYIRKSLSVSNGATLNAATSCFILPSSFTGITNSGAATLGGVKLESGATWNLNSELTISDLYILSGGTVNANSYNLNLTQSAGGGCNGSGGEVFEVQAGGTFNPGTGTVVFDLPYWTEIKILGTVTFNNISIESNTLEVTNGTTITVNGNLTIEEGGDISGSGSGQLSYGPEATLVINTPYTIESWSDMPWGDGSGANVPPNVIVNSELTLEDPKEVTGNIVITENGNLGGASNLNLSDNSTITTCGEVTGNPSMGNNVTVNTCGNSEVGTEINGAGALVVETDDTLTLAANISLGSPGNIIVEPGGKLVVNDKIITCNSVMVDGIIKTENLNGLTGTGSTFGNATVSLNAGSTVEYNSTSGTQIITPRTDYHHLRLSENSNKSFTNNQTYEISGDFTVTGLTPEYGTNTVINFKGAAQTISCNRFHKVTFSNSGNKTLAGTTDITGEITLSGSINLVSNGNLVLKSDINGTASVGPISPTAQVTGNVVVERYIGGSRKWRFLGLPLSGVTFQNSWQNNMHITGPGTGGSMGTTNSNGFDWTAANQPSILYYNETLSGTSSQKWVSITATTNTVEPTRGYRVFVRGDRIAQGNTLIDGSSYTPLPVTIKASGTIVSGQQVVNLTCSNGCTAEDGWNLLSNPYPSTIDWNNTSWVNARPSGIGSTIYIYCAGASSYAAWNPIGGGVNGGSRYIGSGESFFVKTNGNTSLTFEEAYKVYEPSSGLLGKSGLTNNLKIQVSDTSLISECAVFFDQTSTKLANDKYDGVMLAAGAGQVSTFTNHATTKLLFNAIPPATLIDTVQINIPLNNLSKTFTINFAGLSSFSNSLNFYLVDKFTQSIHNLRNNSSYTFNTISGISGSYASNRFALIFDLTGTLPVTFTALTAKASEEGTVLNWQTSSEMNNSHFEIERSLDAETFTTIGSVKGAVNSSRLLDYQFTDTYKNASQTVYYRVKQVDFDNKYSYSNMVALEPIAVSAGHQTTVYPVPAKDYISVQTANKPGEVMEISITDISGKVLIGEQTTLSTLENIRLNSLPAGMYFMNISYSSGKNETIKFIKD